MQKERLPIPGRPPTAETTKKKKKKPGRCGAPSVAPHQGCKPGTPGTRFAGSLQEAKQTQTGFAPSGAYPWAPFSLFLFGPMGLSIFIHCKEGELMHDLRLTSSPDGAHHGGTLAASLSPVPPGAKTRGPTMGPPNSWVIPRAYLKARQGAASWHERSGKRLWSTPSTEGQSLRNHYFGPRLPSPGPFRSLFLFSYASFAVGKRRQTPPRKPRGPWPKVDQAFP